VVRFFFFFSRSLFFDLLPFVVERSGLEEVSPLNMVLLAGWALVPAAAFGLIPDLTGRSTGEGDGLRGVSEELSLALGACFFDFLTVTSGGDSSMVTPGDSSMVMLGDSMVTLDGDSSMVMLDYSSMVTLGDLMVTLSDSSSMVTCDSSSMVTLGENSTCLRLEEVSLVTIGIVVCAGGAWLLALALGFIPDATRRDP